MSKKDDKKISAGQLFKNCLFAVSELFRNAPVFETLFFLETLVASAFASYMSTFYVKMLVDMLERGAPFGEPATLIIVSCAVQIVLLVFENVFSNYEWVNVRLRYQKKFNLRLFRKASNVELACYEDPDFYDKYTRALDGLVAKIFRVSIRLLYSITWLFGTVYMIVYMMAIDPGVGVFMIFPMIGNFFIGKKLSNIEQKRYKENTKFQRMRSYVTRTLHLARYSKEMRLTNVYGLVQEKHRESVEGTNKVYDKYAAKSGFTY